MAKKPDNSRTPAYLSDDYMERIEAAEKIAAHKLSKINDAVYESGRGWKNGWKATDGLSGRITRGMLSLIGNMQITLLERGLVKFLGLKKILRVWTMGAIDKENIDLALKTLEHRNRVKHDERMSKDSGQKPGSDNINSIHIENALKAKKKLEDALIERTLERVEKEYDVLHPDPEKLTEVQVAEQVLTEKKGPQVQSSIYPPGHPDAQKDTIIAGAEIGIDEPDENTPSIVHILTGPETITPHTGQDAINAMEYTYDIDGLNELISRYADLSDEERNQLLQTKKAEFEKYNADLIAVYHKHVTTPKDDVPSQDMAALDDLAARENAYLNVQNLITHAKEIKQASIDADNLYTGNLDPEDVTKNHGLVDYFFRNIEAASQGLNIRIAIASVVGMHALQDNAPEATPTVTVSASQKTTSSEVVIASAPAVEGKTEATHVSSMQENLNKARAALLDIQENIKTIAADKTQTEPTTVTPSRISVEMPRKNNDVVDTSRKHVAVTLPAPAVTSLNAAQENKQDVLNKWTTSTNVQYSVRPSTPKNKR